MSSIEEILGRQINSVKELKSAISELQNSLIGVDTESEQYKTISQQLTAAQAELTKVTRAGKEENNAAADSIRGMEKEYKALYDQYKVLTEEQRNSDIGKNMAASLETLSNKLNETKKEVGNFKDNIGRYAESAGEAFNGMGLSIGGLQTPLKLATGGANTFGTALKSLAANPIVLVITALVAILAKAAEAIKKNEQLSNRLNQALAALKPVTDALANVFDFLAGMIVKVVEGMSNAVEWISKINPKWNAAVKSHKDLAKATNDLTKAQRENSVVLSQKQSEVETLRAEAAAATDATEKQQLLQKAKTMQMEIDQEYVNMAQEELRIMEEYAAKTANSAEDNDKLAAAQKKVNDAIAAGQKRQKEYNEQLKSTNNAIKSSTTSTKNYREEAKKLYEQLIEDNKDEITKLTEKYEKEKKLLTKYHYDTTLLTRKYENDVYKIRKKAADEWVNTLMESQKKVLEALREIEYKNDPVKELEDKLKNLSGATYETAQGLTKNGEIIKKAFEKAANIDITPAKEAAQDLVNNAEIIKKAFENSTNVDVTSLRDVVQDLAENGEIIKKAFQNSTNIDITPVKEAVQDLAENGKIIKKALENATNVDATSLKEAAQGLVKNGKIIKTALENATNVDVTPLRNVVKILQETGVEFYSNATDLDFYIEKLESLQDLPGDAPNTGFVMTQEMIKETIEGLREFGAENLDMLMGDVEKAAKKLNEEGFKVENAADAQVALKSITQAVKELNDEIAKTKGELAQTRIEASAATETENLFKELLSMPDELFNYEDLIKYQEEGERKILEAQKKAYEEELGNFKGTQEQKLEMMQQYYDVAMKLRKMDWDAEQALSDLQKERLAEMIESLIDMTDKIAAAMSTYRSTQEAVIDSQVRVGQIDEKEARKRKKRLLDLQAAETAFSIATITADAASGIFNVWKGYATEVGVINPETAAAAGPGAAVALGGLNAKSLVTAIAKTASLASTAAAQIAAARGGYVSAKNNFLAETTSSTSVAATPNLVDETPYSYTKTVQTTEEEDKLNQPIYVTVTDIEDGLGQRVKVTDETSF